MWAIIDVWSSARGNKVGGLGVMSAASLLGMLVARRFGLRTQLTAEVERGNVGTSDVRMVLVSVLVISLTVEAVIALILGVRWWIHDDFDAARAAFRGVFPLHSTHHEGAHS